MLIVACHIDMNDLISITEAHIYVASRISEKHLSFNSVTKSTFCKKMAVKYHTRSISLPSRSHPGTLQVEEELNKLKDWEGLSTSGSICNGLSALEDLHIYLEDLLKMASTQEVLIHHQRERCLEELLDGSVRLLDVSGAARELVTELKEHAQALQSALRRRKGDSSFESNVANYTCFRKKMKRDSRKLIAELKQMDNKLGASPLVGQDQQLSSTIRVLREVGLVNSNFLQSLLLFLSTPVSKPRQSRWSLVSKLIHKGKVASEEKQETANELESVDASLSEGADSGQMKMAHKWLVDLETSMEDIENCLERVFRRLIKTRASLLNILSQ